MTNSSIHTVVSPKLGDGGTDGSPIFSTKNKLERSGVMLRNEGGPGMLHTPALADVACDHQDSLATSATTSTAVDSSSATSNDNNKFRKRRSSLYQQILAEAGFGGSKIPRTPSDRPKPEPIMTSELDSSVNTIPESDNPAVEESVKASPMPQPALFGVGPAFSFGSGDGVRFSPPVPAGDSRNRSRSRSRGSAYSTHSKETERLCELERELIKERAARSQLQEKLLVSVRSACFDTPSPACPAADGGPVADEHAAEAEAGDNADQDIANGLAVSKELDSLRSQLAAQDKTIEMLCCKIPCKDMLDTLGTNTISNNVLHAVTHVTIVEESPNQTASSPGLVTSLSPSDDAVSFRPSVFGCQAGAFDGTDQAIASPCLSTTSAYSAMSREENIVAVQQVEAALQDATSSLDRALGAISIPRTTPPLSPLACVNQRKSLRAPSLSPESSSACLSTVVRLAQEVQALRNDQHEGEASLQQAVQEAQLRCSKLQHQKSAMSASFQRLAESLSESVLSRPAEGPTTPRGSALARLLEEAKLELQALNESDGSQSSEEEGEGAETVGVQKEEVCVSETQDGEGAHDANMSAMEEWYQSWYEPEPIDDSLANSFLTASLRTTVCKNDAADAQKTDASLWEVQSVVRLAQDSQCADQTLTLAQMDPIAEPQLKGHALAGASRVVAEVRGGGWRVAGAMGRVIWLLASLCLHLLSVSVLVVGVALACRQRTLVGIV